MKSLTIVQSIFCLLLSFASYSQSPKTTPKMMFGHNFGDNYWLANYSQMVQYWKQLEKESDRIKLQQIGITSEGRPMWMAIISAPENLKRLSYYKEISKKLAQAEIDKTEATRLSKIGKTTVWIDGSLHGNEVMPGQAVGRLVQQMVTQDDDETKRFRRDVMLLVCIANPDGMEIVSNTYMSNPDSVKRSDWNVRRWHKYIGHDNNRDFYMSSQKESQAINRALYQEWFPQIVINQHQSGGEIIDFPMSQSPYGPFVDPLVLTSSQMITEAILSRYIAERKPGARSKMYGGANGYLSMTPRFHNMIGIVSEAHGHPNIQRNFSVEPIHMPGERDVNPFKPLDMVDRPWSFSRFLDYQITMNRAVIDMASLQREQLLLRIYIMGCNSILKGSSDTWPIYPENLKVSSREMREISSEDGIKRAFKLDPESRNPRAFIISKDQPDFPTAVKFVNVLMTNGVIVHRATKDFQFNGKTYPNGSFIVKAAQAFRPFVMEMFEPVDEKGSSYALAEQMGVSFDRALDEVKGLFEQLIQSASSTVSFKILANASGYGWSGASNNAFTVAQRLLSKGYAVSRDREGNFYTKAQSGAVEVLKKCASDLGIIFILFTSDPRELHNIKLPRIGIVEGIVGGGDYTAGWYRFLFDQFEIPYTELLPEKLESLDSKKDFDIIIAITGNEIFAKNELKPRQGQAKASIAVPKIREFINEGGTLIMGGSVLENTLEYLNLPLKFIKGDVFKKGESFGDNLGVSIQELHLNEGLSLTNGMKERISLTFYPYDGSFVIDSSALKVGFLPIADFNITNSTTKGNRVIQERLKNTVPIAELPMGKGRIILFGMNPNFRYQSHAAFKLIFNALYP